MTRERRTLPTEGSASRMPTSPVLVRSATGRAPQPTVPMFVRVDAATRDRIAARALTDGVSLTGLVRAAIAAYLDNPAPAEAHPE